MTSLLKLIIFTLCLALTQCYVAFGTTDIDIEGYNQDKNTISEGQWESAADSADSHISVIIKPSEIKEPQSLQEIINFIGSDMLSTNSDGGADDVGDNSRETLTYTELSKLLAFYQWAKEHNFYEMRTETTEPDSNFVTVL